MVVLSLSEHPLMSFIKRCLHWRRWYDNASDNDTRQRHASACLGHLGQSDRDRIISIYVVPPKVAKASTVMRLLPVAVADGYANKCRQCKRPISVGAGNTNLREGSVQLTVDLLIKVACFCKEWN